MPFVAAVPGMLSALGVGGSTLATVGTALGAASSALGLAQGIARKDPMQVLGSLGSGISGAFGALVPKAAPSLPSSVGQGLGASTPGAMIGGTLGQSALGPATSAMNAASPLAPAAAALPNAAGALAPSASITGSATLPHELMTMNAPAMAAKQSPFAIAGNVLSGLTSAGSGILGLIQSLRSHPPVSGMQSMGNIGGNLPAAGGVQTASLPRITPTQVPGGGQVPNLDMQFLRANPKLLQLLGAYQA